MHVFTYLRWVLPFGYLFRTRLRQKQDRISWLLIHPLPVLFLAVAAQDPGQGLSTLIVALLGFLAFQALYEIGYMDNDVFTTKRELNPTLRLSQADTSLLESKFAVIVATRLLIFVICIAIVDWLSIAEARVALGLFLVACATTAIAFAVHNRIRNRWNVLTYAILATGRYVSVPLLAWGLDAPSLLLAAFMMMPLPRTLEHASKPKYRFDVLRRISVPFERFRPAYYLVSLLAYTLSVGVASVEARTGLMVLFFFLMYRVAIFVAIRNKFVSPTIHQAYVKRADKGDH